MLKKILYTAFIIMFLSCNTSKENKIVDKNKNSFNENLSEDLYFAIKNENYNQAYEMLLENVDPNYANNEGVTTLMLAIQKANLDLIKMIIKSGAYINTTDNNNWSPLNYAIYFKDINIAKLLIQNGANVNNESSYSPLIHAIMFDKLDIAYYLIENGVALNSKEYYGWTPLMIALAKGDYSFSKYLINLGVQTDVTSFNGKDSTVSLAASSRFYDLMDFFIEEKETLNNYDMNAIAWAYATDSSNFQDLQKALNYSVLSNENTNYENGYMLDTLAVIYSNLEDWDLAIKYQEDAVELLKDDEYYNETLKRLELYKSKIKYKE